MMAYAPVQCGIAVRIDVPLPILRGWKITRIASYSTERSSAGVSSVEALSTTTISRSQPGSSGAVMTFSRMGRMVSCSL